MPDSDGILHKLNRAFLFQGALIAVAAILGVFFAKIVIEEILVKNAIQQEQDFFWNQYDADPGFPLPHTKNLTGYFSASQLPEFIQQDLPLAPGMYEYNRKDDRQVLQVSEYAGKTLYLIYYRGQVDALVLYYGLFPLLTVLVILYLSLWLTYRFNRKTVSPEFPTTIPSFNNSLAIILATGFENSAPIISPLPLIDLIRGLLILDNSSLKLLPISKIFFNSLSLSRSKTIFAAATEIGFPPNVEP